MARELNLTLYLDHESFPDEHSIVDGLRRFADFIERDGLGYVDLDRSLYHDRAIDVTTGGECIGRFKVTS